MYFSYQHRLFSSKNSEYGRAWTTKISWPSTPFLRLRPPSTWPVSNSTWPFTGSPTNTVSSRGIKWGKCSGISFQAYSICMSGELCIEISNWTTLCSGVRTWARGSWCPSSSTSDLLSMSTKGPIVSLSAVLLASLLLKYWPSSQDKQRDSMTKNATCSPLGSLPTSCTLLFTQDVQAHAFSWRKQRRNHSEKQSMLNSLW